MAASQLSSPSGSVIMGKDEEILLNGVRRLIERQFGDVLKVETVSFKQDGGPGKASKGGRSFLRVWKSLQSAPKNRGRLVLRHLPLFHAIINCNGRTGNAAAAGSEGGRPPAASAAATTSVLDAGGPAVEVLLINFCGKIVMKNLVMNWSDDSSEVPTLIKLMAKSDIEHCEGVFSCPDVPSLRKALAKFPVQSNVDVQQVETGFVLCSLGCRGIAIPPMGDTLTCFKCKSLQEELRSEGQTSSAQRKPIGDDGLINGKGSSKPLGQGDLLKSKRLPEGISIFKVQGSEKEPLPGGPRDEGETGEGPAKEAQASVKVKATEPPSIKVTRSFSTRLSDEDADETCKICLRRFRRRCLFELDQKAHRDRFDLDLSVECPVCQEQIETKMQLTDHFAALHSSIGTCCCECLQVVPVEDEGLWRHMTAKHNSRGKVLCQQCGKKVGEKYMRQHLARNHPNPKNMVMCHECGKEFGSIYMLKVHQRNNHDRIDIPCSKCGRKFSRREKLSGHVRIHTGLKPYQCKACDYRSYRCSNIYIHIQTVHGRKGTNLDIITYQVEKAKMDKAVKDILDKSCKTKT